MADTITESTTHPQRAALGQPEIGVVVLYSRGPIVPFARSVPASASVGREGDVQIDDAGASRVHARFDNRGAALWVSDLDSRNGTFLNGAAIATSGQLAPPGSVVRVGRTLLLVLADVTPWFAPPVDAAGLVGGPALDDARHSIATIAPTPAPVLILGETGTGKELVANAIHRVSGRSGNFVALNCAAVPSELVDAELFGHTRGAFSGATAARGGLIRAADGGTLFLDEVGEMTPPIQAKLLRTLETREVRSVGEDRVSVVDVRFVAATNRDLVEQVDSGGFRGDLLHRLSGFGISLPPLRSRIEDVGALAEAFLAGSGLALSVLALEQLLLHGWPGNVRELKNVIAAASAVAQRRGHAEIELEDLPRLTVPEPRSRPPAAEDPGERIRRALAQSGGDVAQAARELSTSRTSLYETLRRLGIDAKSFRRR